MRCHFVRKIAIAVGPVMLMLATSCQTAAPVRATGPRPRVTALPREIRVRVNGRVTRVAFEDYVAGTAISEVTPVGETPRTIDRVYDVQTIVARTYAAAHLGRHQADGFDVCDSTHCQLYQPARLATSRFSAEVRRAVGRTAGVVLMYRGQPIDALFHSDCGGRTASPPQVWGTAPLPYLRSEPDLAPDVAHRAWTLSLTETQLRAALNADSRTKVGRQLTSFTASAPDASGRVPDVSIVGDQRLNVRTDDLRAALNRTLIGMGLPSARFTLQRSGANYIFKGTGYGHGIGLCQTGAIARARTDAATASILSSYFPGALLEKLGQGRSSGTQ